MGIPAFFMEATWSDVQRCIVSGSIWCAFRKMTSGRLLGLLDENAFGGAISHGATYVLEIPRMTSYLNWMLRFLYWSVCSLRLEHRGCWRGVIVINDIWNVNIVKRVSVFESHLSGYLTLMILPTANVSTCLVHQRSFMSQTTSTRRHHFEFAKRTSSLAQPLSSSHPTWPMAFKTV